MKLSREQEAVLLRQEKPQLRPEVKDFLWKEVSSVQQLLVLLQTSTGRNGDRARTPQT